MEKISFHEFVQLPDDEQDRRFKEVGIDSIDSIKGDYKSALKKKHFISRMKFTDSPDRLIVRKDGFMNSLDVEYKSNYEPLLCFSYILVDGKWRISFNDRVVNLRCSHLCEDVLLYRDYYNFYDIQRQFQVVIPNCQSVYNRMLREGKTIFDFVRWEDTVVDTLYRVNVSSGVQEVYGNLQNIYMSYARRAEFIQLPYLYKNPGMMTPATLVAFMTALRLNAPDCNVTPKTAMMVYYILHTGQSNMDKNDIDPYINAMTPKALTDLTVLEGLGNDLDGFNHICETYKAELPSFPFSDYIKKYKDEFQDKVGELRHNLMNKYGLDDSVFNNPI